MQKYKPGLRINPGLHKPLGFQYRNHTIVIRQKLPPSYLCTERTNSVQKELGLGGEVIIDDVVQEWDVDTTSCHVSHQQHHCFAVDKATNVDLSGRLV